MCQMHREQNIWLGEQINRRLDCVQFASYIEDHGFEDTDSGFNSRNIVKLNVLGRLLACILSVN